MHSFRFNWFLLVSSRGTGGRPAEKHWRDPVNEAEGGGGGGGRGGSKTMPTIPSGPRQAA